VRVIGCAVDDDVAVCTCLIVVAVANATATPKATMSAVKANFGPMMRPPISVSSTPAPRIWAADATIQIHTGTWPAGRSALRSRDSLMRSWVAVPKST